MENSLRKLLLKKSYTSRENDLAIEFFNPVLSLSREYLRVSAYYSSYSMLSISKGMSEMFTNSGKMKLIISFFVNEEDYEAFVNGRRNPQDYIVENFLNDKEQLRKMMMNNSVEAFAKLTSSGRLTIKFVISDEGIFHEKYGIIFDENGDYISFSGSLNETHEGLTVNFEKIKVFRGWIREEDEYIQSDLREFYKYWKGEVFDCLVVDIPDKSKNLIMDAYEEFQKEKTVLLNRNKIETLKLRKYQEGAIEAWKSNNYRGILEMATGTGKTITALEGLKQFLVEKSPSMVVLAVPTDILVTQWQQEITRFDLPCVTVKLSGTGSIRIQDLYTYLNGLDKSSRTNIILVGTYKILSAPKFTTVIPHMFDGVNLIIADEVHHIGAEVYSNIMLESFQYRLGLSATPERYFDDDGTLKIKEYFGEVIFSYDIKQAISEGVLCPYTYNPVIATLTDEEMNEYASYSKKLNNIVNRKNGSVNASEENRLKIKKMEDLLNIQRSRIVKKAFNKQRALEKILQDLNEKEKLHHLLVYFEDSEQIEEFYTIFEKFSVTTATIDAGTSLEKRSLILNKLSNGNINIVLAMKILDEGVDIPSVERAVIVASSGNPAQYIQRRGRLLREYPGKVFAEIYDITVIADVAYGITEMTNEEISITRKEIKRVKLFCETAMNKNQCQRLIYEVSLKYNLNL